MLAVGTQQELQSRELLAVLVDCAGQSEVQEQGSEGQRNQWADQPQNALRAHCRRSEQGRCQEHNIEPGTQGRKSQRLRRSHQLDQIVGIGLDDHAPIGQAQDRKRRPEMQGAQSPPAPAAHGLRSQIDQRTGNGG